MFNKLYIMDGITAYNDAVPCFQTLLMTNTVYVQLSPLNKHRSCIFNVQEHKSKRTQKFHTETVYIYIHL